MAISEERAAAEREVAQLKHEKGILEGRVNMLRGMLHRTALSLNDAGYEDLADEVNALVRATTPGNYE